MNGGIALVAVQNIIALINGAIQACLTYSKVLYTLHQETKKQRNKENLDNRFMQ
jgi:hypothetical protein